MEKHLSNPSRKMSCADTVSQPITPCMCAAILTLKGVFHLCVFSPLNAYGAFHALNVFQKFNVTEPEVSQSGTLNFSKRVRILECAWSLFNRLTVFPSTLLGTAAQDTL